MGLRSSEIQEQINLDNMLEDTKNKTSRPRIHQHSIVGTRLSKMFKTPNERNNSKIEKDSYWKERVDLLVYEKKKWLKERKEFHSKITELTDLNEMYEIKIKYLKDTINRAGDFDQMEFDFPAEEEPEFRKSVADPNAIREEINSEFIVNN